MAADTSVISIDRHIIEEERRYPEARGALSNILTDLALAAKLIQREVSKAGLVDILGATGDRNVQGERVQKLDVFANEVIYKALDHAGLLCCMASEESEDVIPIPDRFPTGDYVLLYDPLDGSSNIDVNVSIGTIFSILRKVSGGDRGGLEDCLQPGYRQVAAGYVVYGSSTMLVYTSGNGVHGFTLDPSIGEFLLSHPDIRMPQPPKRVYSVNESYYPLWHEGQKALMRHLKGTEDGAPRLGRDEAFTSRYIGSLVADFHRTILTGGIFMYPPDEAAPTGKLRLLYEVSPLAFICEEAGGRASDGHRDILSIEPTELHQRTPLYMGSREFVDLAEEYLEDDPDPLE
ncbi:MAG: class 1 fructose-bisphosphatase [Longimicrobiales bacterium]|nr:class 1 fructose-bisphosphatase [Longimicrobiales bacterium]